MDETGDEMADDKLVTRVIKASGAPVYDDVYAVGQRCDLARATTLRIKIKHYLGHWSGEKV